MVEVDPLVLAAGAAAIAVLSVVSCARNGKKSSSKKEEGNEKKEIKTEKKNKKNEVNKVTTPAASAPAPAPAPAQGNKENTKSSKVKNNVTPVAAAAAAPQAVAPQASAPVPAPTKSAEAKSAPVVKSSAKAVPVPQAAPEPTPTTPVEAITASESGEKKKKKETPEQKAARLERQKKRKEQQAVEAAGSTPEPPRDERVEFVSRVPAADVWEVVEDKKKQKTKKAPPTASTESLASTPAAESSDAVPVDQTTSKLTVDPKKIGIIIGPKGATLRSIQELTEATINMPKDRDSNAKSASISLVGSVDAVQNATNIIIELCTKGYSTRLEGENFQESHLSVHSQFLPEIIGKSGASIRALQDKLGVRITIPPNAGKDATAMVKIGIAGDRENINRAKEVIREIMTYYHSPITHPDYVHVSLDIPPRMYNSIIGTKGGEIRHIQNNFKVTVHIPNPNSLTQHVIVVGEQSNQVDNAVRYIQKIVQQITTEEAKTATVVETWNEQSDLLSGEDPEPEWVSQYMYNREASKQVNLMAAVNVPISLATAESNAWKMGDAADGW